MKKLFDYLQMIQESKTTKKKDLHVYHVEQLASNGDIKTIKEIFNSILRKITSEETDITITQKIDGVPILFGNTEVDGDFIALKNKAFRTGKIDKSQVFYLLSEIQNSDIGENNKGLLINCWKNLISQVSKNTVYFGELLFSDHLNKNKDDKKNQGKIKVDKNFVISQPNLLYYKINGVKDSQNLGILEIGKASNIKDLNEFKSSDISNSSWKIKSNNVFITDGSISLEINKNNKLIKDIYKKIESLPETDIKNSKFRITEFFNSNKNFSKTINLVSEIKEDILNILKTKRNIIGLKGIESNEEIDEGVVVKNSDYIVKLVSKDFFVYAKESYSKSTGVDRGSELKQFKVLFVGKFQPFHNGHLSAFKDLQKSFGNNNVFLVTSDSNSEGPLNFKDKEKLMVESGIPKSQIKLRTPDLKMYSFSMVKQFLNPSEDIAVYAISDKQEDSERIKESPKNKIEIVKNKEDFENAKKLVSQSLNALRDAKINYTFITYPKALKENSKLDLSAKNLREKLKNGKSIQQFIPYDELKNKQILEKFK